MKSRVYLMSLVSLLFLTASCIKKSVKPSDAITIESRSLSGFDKLDVSDALDVYLTMGSSEGVVIEANENLHDYIITDVVNGRLKIRLKNNVRIKSGATIKIYVNAVSMGNVTISGASRVEVSGEIHATDFKMDISGASSFQGSVYSTNSEFEISGASRVETWGGTTDARINISGASNFSDFDYAIAGFLNADLSGASKVSISCDGTMDIEASGASTFEYKGDALIDHLDLSGASTIHKF